MSNFEDDDRPTFRAITLKMAVEDAAAISARRERRRIRRLIAPHLKVLLMNSSHRCGLAGCIDPGVRSLQGHRSGHQGAAEGAKGDVMDEETKVVGICTIGVLAICALLWKSCDTETRSGAAKDEVKYKTAQACIASQRPAADCALIVHGTGK